MSNKKLVIAFLVVFIVMLLMGGILGVVYYKKAGFPQCQYNGAIYKNGQSFKDSDDCNTCSCDGGVVVCTLMACESDAETPDNNDDQSKESTKYNGTFISAELPEGWKISEGVNGAGASLLTDTTYEGLTSFIISLNGVNKFEVKGADGVGGSNECLEYPQFKDFNTSHFNEVSSEAADMSETTKLVDYTAAKLFEFTSLEQNYRRIGTKLYRDADSTNTTFEPACGKFEYSLFVAEDLYFISQPPAGTDGPTVKNDLYLWKYVNDPTSDELLIIDGILESLEINEYTL